MRQVVGESKGWGSFEDSCKEGDVGSSADGKRKDGRGMEIDEWDLERVFGGMLVDLRY